MIWNKIKLNKEITSLSDEITELKFKLKRKDEILGEYEAIIENKREEISALNEGKSKLEKENKEIKKVLREKTSADLLANAIKAIQAPKEDLPKYLAEEQRLMSLRNLYLQTEQRAYYQNPLGGGNLLSGLLGVNL